jgi:hypothetical protein
LLYPAGLVFDASGNLLFAEAGRHTVKKIAVDGTLTTVAGSGVQGFSGDGGSALLAQLDSPSAVALDAAGNLFVADTHNHRIRRIDAVTGEIGTFAGTGVAGSSLDGTLAQSARLDAPVALVFDPGGNLIFADARTHLIRRIAAATGRVTTLAGSGVQGFSGDGGLATGAAIDSPYGLACDAAGNLFFADTHNHRVRRVDVVTGRIATVAGSGVAGFAGEMTAASLARLDLPRGLVADASGNLFLADAGNQRIRRVDAGTGLITSITGDGVQGFAGDGGPAAAAELNSPRAVSLSAKGLPTFSDTGNNRIRQVDAASVVHTIGGIGGGGGAESLTLAAPAVLLYGTGTAAATLTASPATGSVSLFDNVGGSLLTIGSASLLLNEASLSTAALQAGSHRLQATYGGDAGHLPAQSNTLAVTVDPATVLVQPNPASILYGQAIPQFSGTLAGVLTQDAGQVTLALATSAQPLSPPGVYPITASLGGARAGNYTVSQTPASLTIAKAPTQATLSQALATHVASSTSGQPSGIVTLLDAGTPAASLTLSASGDAVFSASPLSAGSHTLSVAYGGDPDFLAATSPAVVVTIGPTAAPDFSLAVTGASSVVVPSGSAATFSFAVSPLNGPVPSAIVLSVTGLPAGASASFNPASVPPSSATVPVTLTVLTPRAALEPPTGKTLLVVAALLPLGWLRRRRFGLRGLAAAAGLAVLACTSGCGARTVGYAAGTNQGVAYNITVTGTSTSATGAVLVHSVPVVLTTN